MGARIKRAPIHSNGGNPLRFSGSRTGEAAAEPISLKPGEREIQIPLKLRDNGVYTIEAYLTEFVPFSNRVLIKFGIYDMGGATSAG